MTDAKPNSEVTSPVAEVIAEPCQRLVNDRARLLAAIRAKKHAPTAELAAGSEIDPSVTTAPEYAPGSTPVTA
ncbi:MAG: hypothetical protein SFX74_00135 [Fimbriimonadaceae bacterium]|nr:hypothetical protein [Fimbriimonadaceae bacterium]